MELIIIAGAIVLGVVVYYNWSDHKSPDLNADGKVDLADAKIAVSNTKKGIAADIVKVKTAAKKVAAKKPTAKKSAAKAKPAVKAKPAKKK